MFCRLSICTYGFLRYMAIRSLKRLWSNTWITWAEAGVRPGCGLTLGQAVDRGQVVAGRRRVQRALDEDGRLAQALQVDVPVLPGQPAAVPCETGGGRHGSPICRLAFSTIGFTMMLPRMPRQNRDESDGAQRPSTVTSLL